MADPTYPTPSVPTIYPAPLPVIPRSHLAGRRDELTGFDLEKLVQLAVSVLDERTAWMQYVEAHKAYYGFFDDGNSKTNDIGALRQARATRQDAAALRRTLTNALMGQEPESIRG